MVYTVAGKEHKSSWIAALSRWNAGKGVWCTPRKGTPEHAQVKAIQSSMMRKGPPPRPKSAAGMSGAGLLGRIDRPSMAPAPSAQAFANMYRDSDVVAMPKREPANMTAQYVTLESTKERPASEVKWAPPPKAKKRAVLTSVMDVAEVVDESDANGPWEDVGNRMDGMEAKEGGRFKEAQMMSALSKKVQRKEWRKRQKKKYGTVRKYGERADIRKKSRPVTRKINRLVRGK